MKNCVVSENKRFAIQKILQYFNKKLCVVGKKIFFTEEKKITLGESIL